MTNYEKLEARFRQYNRLNDLRSIAGWDEAVVMPVGAGDARGQALAELSMVMQNLVSSPDIGEWLSAIGSAPDLSAWQSANVTEIRRLYLENTAIPVELNQRLVMARMHCEQLWRRLRGENNWRDFLPSLDEVLRLTREMLRILSGELKMPLYDSALMLYSKGLTTTAVESLFGELKTFLPDMIREVVAKQAHEKVLAPEGIFPMAAQKALGLELMRLVGFDFNHGRLDESHHPFCGGNPHDVRITTRYDESDFLSSLMGVLHETGHALYEQNLPAEWVEQPVGQACGMAIHESQSLLMEMQVVRSREFMSFAAPLIRKHFAAHTRNPESLEDENLMRLVTRVAPGLIRVDADEVTYPAHVILRFEIERDLLEDRWPLTELPDVWNQKMQKYLGLSTVGDFKNGCMQDVHWPSGGWGYFPAYTFGAVIAAQLFAAAESARPSVRSEIGLGQFGGLQDWLRAKIWSQGSRLDTLQLVSAASGPLSVAPFRKHLENRYLKN
jgi:carboxypeptidase Taq